MAIRLLLVVIVVMGVSCSARPQPTAHSAPPVDASLKPDENLNAVLWMQTALEYEAAALQAYRTARLQLEAALGTPGWTAAVEQAGDTAGLPPAVILDIDETVLDNSYYQARMVRNGTAYSDATWNAWVEERKATAIPGALEFTRDAAQRGVTVFYVTNRAQQGEQATRDNLAALGFPVAPQLDTVLTRGERPEWQASAKAARRAHVAERFRILLLIGDDLGDFVADASGTPDQRRLRTAGHADRWGRQWIVLPNPTYGSWERAIVGASRDPIDVKRRALRVDPQ
jgi:5'-nucleotidase (lipoprotein e(P4) family)